DIVLPATFGAFGDFFLCLALGADEQHAPAIGNDIAQGLQRIAEHRRGLLQVENMNAVAYAEAVLAHLGVPAAGVVSEVNARFEQLAHGESRHSHGYGLLLYPVISSGPPWPVQGTG